MATTGWVNPKKITDRQRMDRRLERAGLLNYQTQGLSAQEIAHRYAKANIKIAGNSSWFKDNYGFDAPDFVTDRQKMAQYRANPQAYLPNVFPTVQPRITPAGGNADRPQNFINTGMYQTPIIPVGPTLTNANSPYAPMVFGTPEQAKSGEIAWADVSASDRKKILSDPNFYKSGAITQYPTFLQQEMLADPNFKWDELPKWQRTYYSVSSNPAGMGAIQGATLGAGGGLPGIVVGGIVGGGLGYAAGVSGYDPTKEAWEQGDGKFTMDGNQVKDAVKGAFGWLNFSAEQMEKAIGTAAQVANAAADPNRRVADLLTDFESTWNSSANFFEVITPAINEAFDPRNQGQIERTLYPSALSFYLTGKIGDVILNPDKYKGQELYLGASNPVPLDESWIERIDAARTEIQAGRPYREVMLEMQNGIMAQVGDMAGQAIADPLNVVGKVTAKTGEVTARVTGDKVAQSAFAGASGPFDAVQRLRNTINSPGAAQKIDPNFRVDEMGWLTKKMSGLTSDGKIAASRFTDKGLLDYTTPKKKNLRGFVESLVTLNPESRARVGQDMLVRNVGNIMASWFGGQDVDGFYKWWKSFSNGDMTQAAELSNAVAQAPEFYTVLPAAKGFDIEGSYTKWTATEQPRQVITRLAEMLGENPQTLIDDLVKRGTAEQDFVRVQDRLTKLNSPEAKALLAEMQAGRLTADMLADAVKLFSGGDVPFHPAQWMAQTLDDLKAHYDQWAINNFKLDEESRKTLFRVTGVMKSMQSILLLGANPGYMISNVLPTMATRAFDGVWGYMTPASIDRFMTRMGFDVEAGLIPSRMEEGVGPGGMVDQARGQGDALRDAVRGTGWLKKADDFFGRFGRVMPFNKLSRVLEGYEGKQAYVIGIAKFMGEGWRREKGFRAIPNELRAELTRVMGDRATDMLYSAIEAGMSKQEIRNIITSASANLKARSLIHEAAQGMNVPTSKAAAMLEQMGILDAIDAQTRNATTESKVRAAFERAKREAKYKVDEQAARDSVAMMEHIANRLQVEGPKALTDIVLDMEEKGIEQWLQHYERMGEAADAMDSIANPNTRSNLWSYKYAESNAEFRRFNAMRGATYMGVMKAVGMSENPTARRLLATMADTDRTLDSTYRQMRDLRDGHFQKWNSDWDNPRRKVEYKAIEKQINDLWKAATKREIENSRQFGELLGQQYQELFGIEAGEAARQAWEQITAFRQEMTKRRDDFRKSIEGKTYAERQIDSREFWGKTYKYMIVEMERIKTEAIRNLDRIANKRKGGGDTTPTPAPTDPTPPTQPPPTAQDTPPATTQPMPDEMATLRQQAEARLNATQARIATVWEVAGDFGYSADQNPHALMSALYKYGDPEILGWDDPKLTPDFIRSTLEKRAEIKAEQQARMEANAAEIALSQVEQDTVSKPRNEIPPTLSDALMLEARRIADVIAGGEPGKRLFSKTEGFIGATKSTYPNWYNDLQASVGGRKKLLAALDKIVKDAGVDKGVVVGRVKEFLLSNLKYGDADTNNPPNLQVLKDLGADEAVMVKAADDFNIMMGTNFTLDQLLAGDYSSAFETYFDGAMAAANAFDDAGWQARMLDAYEQGDYNTVLELAGDLPADLLNEPFTFMETYGEYLNRVTEETQTRARQNAEDMAIAENQVRAENALKEQQDAAEMGMTRQQFRESLTEIVGLAESEAEAVMSITDARANAYGDAAEWYRTRIAEVQRAGDKPQLFQMDDADWRIQDYLNQAREDFFFDTRDDFKADWVREAVKSFGITDDLNEGGYILQDGRMLDFSGKRQGGSGGRRSLDHRDITDAFHEDYDVQYGAIDDFNAVTGSIRHDFNQGEMRLDIFGTPTSSQLRIIQDAIDGGDVEKIYIDFSTQQGNVVTSLEFEVDAGGEAVRDAIKKATRYIYESDITPSLLRQNLDRVARELGGELYQQDQYADSGMGDLRKLIDEYEEGTDLTINDVINEAEAIFRDNEIPDADELISTIEDYRATLEEDFTEFGLRGDSSNAAETLVSKINSYVEKYKGEFHQREQQGGMWEAGEDTPLFSGTAQRVKDEAYTPTEAGRQEAMFDMRPPFGTGEPSLAPRLGEPKGGVRFMEDGRAIIRAFEKADVSTVVHEIGHIFRRDLKGNDLAIIEAWAEVKDGNWTRDAEEKFARGFEKYLADGSAPTAKLRAVFEQFKVWMREIYRAVTGSPIDIDLSPAVKEVFDRLLTGEEGPRHVDVGDMLTQMGYDPAAYYMTPDGRVSRRPELNIRVDKSKTNRALDEVVSKDFMDKVQALRRTSQPAGEFVDTKVQAPPSKTPVWQMSYEQYKAMLLQDQRDYASRRMAALQGNELNEMGADFTQTEAARMQKWMERETLAWERYGDVREKYMSAVNDALVDEQPVPNEIKQAFYEMGKSGELSEAERRRMGQAGRGAGELFQNSELPQTGREYTFKYQRNNEKSPNMGGRFGQDIEPAGRYLVEVSDTAELPTWGNFEEGTITFKNPLVLEWGEGYQSAGNWKNVLSQMYGGKKGRNLSKALRKDGYDGIITIENGRTSEIVDIGGIYQDGDTRVLFQDADPRMPLGGYEEAAGWKPDSMGMDELWAQEISPLLDGMEEAAVRRLNEPTMDGAYRDMSAEGQEMLRQYMRGVETDLASTKMAATRWGQTKRDQSLLNYNRRTGFDQWLDIAFPYQFFYTRSMMTWAMRAIDNPAILANYARLRRQQDRYENNLPERLRGKMRIEAPWMPDWMGDALYIDPLSVIFTPHNFMRPFEQMAKDNNMQMIEAERILQEWSADERIPMEQIQEAAQTRSGKVWEQALAEAKMRRDAEISNPLDFVSATFGPAWYLSTPAKLLGLGKDGPETLTEVPLTRTARAFETVTKDTWMEPAGKLIGLLAKPEEALRKKYNLPEMGEYGDYYIDRQLSNMVAEGKITSEEAIISMIEREGELFEEARERVKLELAMRIPLMGATYAALNEGGVAGLKALPASLFGSGLLPEGELKYRGVKQEWNDAWKLKDAGDEGAINRFFDEHPEYESYLAKGKEPEERLRSFLIGQIWDGYMGLGETDRRTARAEMGEVFSAAFLNSETRSYDTLDVETLTQWAQMVNKNVPTTPETLPAIEAPRQINYFAPEMTQITDTYYDQRKRLHPNYFEFERAYYALPKSERRGYLIANPQLKEYWNWKDGWYTRYPELVPVFNGQVFKRVDTSNWSPLLVQGVQMYAMMGQPLGTGAYKALEQQWIQAGRPRESVKDWLGIDLAPAMIYQGAP